MSDHKIKRHNKSLLLYHIVIPLKYRRNVINKEVGETLIKICFEISERYEVKAILWNGKFWTSGYYVNTVGQYSNEEVIRAYVKNQGKEKEYKKLHQQQLKLLF